MLPASACKRMGFAALLCGCAIALAQAQMPASPPRSATVPSVDTRAATDPIPFAPAHPGNFRVPSAADAWGGPRTGNEATLSDRVVRYAIDARLDPVRHGIDGSERLSWRNRSDRAVGVVYLHLYLNAFDGPGSTFASEASLLGDEPSRADEEGRWGYVDLLSVRQGGMPVRWTFVHPDGGPASDHTVVRLDLAEAVPAHATLDLDIGFHDQLPRVVARTGWFGRFQLVAQWFPKIGVLELAGERGATAPRWNVHEFHFNSEFYADYGSFDVHLTVPRDYTVGAVGEERGPALAKGDEVTRHFVQDDVHDFAWVAAPGLRTLDGTWSGAGSPDVRVRVIYPPEYAASAQPVLQAALDALGYFSRTLGPYPYRTVTAVVPPFNAGAAGGMEYPTFFTVDAYRSVAAGTIDAAALDFVTIHEFGHGYFYGILGFNEFEEPMLDEGLNEYWDQRMVRGRPQDMILTTPLLRWLGIAPVVDAFAYERFSGAATLGQPPDTLDSNAWDRLSDESYGSVYSRTATAMHDLEERLGRDVTERAFREFYARWKFRHPSAADLRDVLAEGSGKPDIVDAMFAQQVYGAQKIDDRVARVESEELEPQAGTVVRAGRHVVVSDDTASQSADRQRAAWKAQHPHPAQGTGPFPWRTVVTVRRDGAAVPQTLLVKFTDGSQVSVLWNDDAHWRRFSWVRPAKAVSAELDPQRAILLDADKLNDSHAVRPDRSAANRWTGDAAALLQSVIAAVTTL